MNWKLKINTHKNHDHSQSVILPDIKIIYRVKYKTKVNNTYSQI